MDKILINDFIKAWDKVCENEKNELLKIWTDKGKFTSKMLYYEEDSIIKKISKKLGLIPYVQRKGGYYELDVVFFEKQFEIPDTGKETWLRNIKIALEHENECNEYIFEEISRLLTCNCELRVLVTYPKKRNKNEILNNLKYLFKNIDEFVLMISGFKNNNKKIIWEYCILNKNGIIHQF